jgi:hypothetical protein
MKISKSAFGGLQQEARIGRERLGSRPIVTATTLPKPAYPRKYLIPKLQ